MTDLPLSRRIPVADVSADGLDVEVVATEAERAALAELNETPSIERLVGQLRLRAFGRAGVAVTGRVTADVTRTCVVSLDPFPESVDEKVDVRFVPAADLPTPEPGEEIEIRGDDGPDSYYDGAVDVGAVVAEFFTLGLDPHPRKPGAVFAADSGSDDPESPFAKLARLKSADRDT